MQCRRHRIEFAREVAKTALPERQARLRELLIENAYIVIEKAIETNKPRVGYPVTIVIVRALSRVAE